jgi:hypothetical protein
MQNPQKLAMRAAEPGQGKNIGSDAGAHPTVEQTMGRILKPLTYLLAALYLLVDAVFMPMARQVSNWIAGHFAFRRLRAWIRSLSPYASLALFSVPVMVLEPVKPLAAYLAATGQWLVGAVTLIVGELLKLVLVERLFSLTRDKLMTIPAFARAYGKFQDMKAWLEATEAWRTMRALSRLARDYVARIKATLSGRSISFEGE